MTELRCACPIPLATLLDLWLDELNPEEADRLDEHLLGCGHCSAHLQELVEMAEAIRAAARGGAVQAIVTDAFVKRLASQGLRLREYRVPHNGSVHCTVTPEDDLLITRLRAPLADVERLDLEQLDGVGQVIERLRDVPFDAATGEVIVSQRMQSIRALPEATLRMRLLASAPSGQRLIGEYTFHHTPNRTS